MFLFIDFSSDFYNQDSTFTYPIRDNTIDHGLKNICMKSLLILTGIILLSFQINRLIVNNSDEITTVSEIKLLDDKFITKNNLPVIDSVYRGAKSIKAEAEVSVKAEVNTVNAVTAQSSLKAEETTAKAATEQVVVKVKTTVKTLFSEEQNKNFMMLHKLIKQSGNYIALSTVQFDFDERSVLDSESFQMVMKFADRLVFDDSLKVSIAGFTDNTGLQAYNEQLSWYRADDVRKYFLELGVKENQIMISANGVLDPVASNKTPEGRAQNRRVEMVLLK